ncbi:MAG TPA: GAF domain-containing protein, partial [Chloroflexota bacterium]|nr:GAF domain-containing protein [Chloroflexota bacterium]
NEAAHALSGCDGKLYLADDPAWRHLIPLEERVPDAVGSQTQRPTQTQTPARGERVALGTRTPLRRRALRPGGAAEHVLTTGERVSLPDFASDSPFGVYRDVHPSMWERGIRARALVPLRTGGRVVGALAVNFERPGELAAEDWEVLELFAAHAAAAVERARLALAVRRPERRLPEILAEIGAAEDVGGALAALLKGAVELLGGEMGGVRAYGVTARQESVALWIGPEGAVGPAPYPEPAPGSVAEALRRGAAPQLIHDVLALASDSPELVEHRRQRGMRSSVAVPLEADGKRVGSLHVDHSWPGYFGAEDLALAEALAAQAGMVIERARLETARRELDQRYRQLVEVCPDAIGVHQNGRIVYANAATARLLGAESPEQLVGLDVMRIVHPDVLAQTPDEMRRLAAGEPMPPAVRRLVRLDGSVVEAEVTGAAIQLDGGIAFQVVARDLTERRGLEAEHEERLRLDGALLVARTVAHELNNTISPVVGFAELLASRESISRDPIAATYVAAIRTAADDTADRVRRLQLITRLERVESPLGPDRPVLDLERSTEAV